MSILVWKNRGEKDISNKPNADYMQQIAFYAQSVYELTGKKPKAGIIASMNIFQSKIHKFDPFDLKLVDGLHDRINLYYSENKG